MYTDGQKRAKVGIVTVDIHGNSYRIRFMYPEGTRHQFTIAKVTSEGWSTAIRAAQLINRDIDLGDFDDTYGRYSPKHARKLELATAESKREYNLKELWEKYKAVKSKTTSETTKVHDWTKVDKLLNKLPDRLLELAQAENMISLLLTSYSPGTLRPPFRLLYAAVNAQVNLRIIPANPYLQVFSPYGTNKEKPQCFESHEVKAIISAFYSNEFKHPKSAYLHSHYAPMVEFLALTGCRPSECHALTWDDIKQSGSKSFVRFNKAWTSGTLTATTKTKETRLFPCNEQLKQLLSEMPKMPNDNNLIFPSLRGGYVPQGHFSYQYWLKIVKELVKQGKVDKYLKPYALRHSFITRLIREGVDIATVASLSGNSVRVIIDNYLASRKDFDLPEL